MIKQIWSSSMASQRRSSASRRQRSASTFSWSGGDGGDPAADAIFVAQSQQDERAACGGDGGRFGVRGSVEWRLWLFECESGNWIV
nr:hypothetical protein CFP56_08254 [Quercus suber]